MAKILKPGEKPEYALKLSHICACLGEIDTLDDVAKGLKSYITAPISVQLEIAQAIEEYQRVMVLGCNNFGKSHLLTRLSLLSLYQAIGRQVILTAVKLPNLRNIIWATLKRLWDNLPRQMFPGRATDLRIAPSQHRLDWFMQGMVSKAGVTESFAGQHPEAGVHLYLDEATAVGQHVYEGCEGMLSNYLCKIIAVANPLTRDCYLYHLSQSSDWIVFNLSAYEHPNYTLGRKLGYGPIRGAFDPTWPDSRKDAWGEDSDLFLSRVMGKWPRHSTYSIIKHEWVMRSVKAKRAAGKYAIHVYGVDVARYGDCESVCYECLDDNYREEFKVQGVWDEDENKRIGSDRIYDLCSGILKDKSPDMFSLDDPGVGGPIADFLMRDGHKNFKRFVPNAKSEKLTEYERLVKIYPDMKKPNIYFADLASEMWWEARKLFEESFDDPKARISIPNDRDLIFQLTERQYGFNSAGEIKIEDKKKYMTRLEKPSPDKADAFVVAVYARKHGLKLRHKVPIKTKTGQPGISERFKKKPKRTAGMVPV